MKSSLLLSVFVVKTIYSIAQAPSITSFTPVSAKPGDAVTITGINFNTTTTNNIVFFGAIKAIVTTATATSLTATVPIGATYAPISLLNTNTGLTAYSLVNFTPMFSPVKSTIVNTDFAPKVDFSTGANPYSVAISDLDGDGKPDLVAVNYSSNTVSVFRNTSSTGSLVPSSFAAKVDFTTGTGPTSVSIRDLDGDGKPDLVVTNYDANTISVFRNTSTTGVIGLGSFLAKVDFVTGTGATSSVIDDLDRDGRPDLVVVNYTSNSISLFRNTSTSGIINASSFAAKADFATGTSPSFVASGDLDGDTKPDLAVTSYLSNTVAVFRNTSISGTIDASSFAPRQPFATGSGPNTVEIGDLDSDGKPDLVVANYNSNTVSILKNNTTTGSIVISSFLAKVDFAVGSRPSSLKIGDLNGDGKPDFAVTNEYSSTVSIFRNVSASGSIVLSSFAAGVDFTTGGQPYSIGISDLDGDHKADLVIANYSSNNISVFRNSDLLPPIINSLSSSSAKPGEAITITGTNFNTIPTNNVLFFGAGKATVTAATSTNITATIPFGATYGPISLLDTSGRLGAFSRNNFTPIFSPSKQVISTNDFNPKVDFTAGLGSRSSAIGDLDGDGKSDLVVVNQGSNTISVYHNISNIAAINLSSFSPKVDFITGSSPYSTAISDIDGDGKLDIVVTNVGSNTISVFRNTSTAGSISASSFAAKQDFITGSQPYSLAITDLEGDGKPDLVVVNYSSNTISILRNTSSRGSIFEVNFSGKVDFPTALNPTNVAVGDLDGDNKSDIVVTNEASNSVSIFRNTSNIYSITASSFSSKVDVTTGTQPFSIALADLDGDSKLDLAVANYGSNNISVLRNVATSGSLATNSFATKVDFAAGSNPTSIAIGDLDGNGKLDLAVTNKTSNTISIFRNNATSGSITSTSFAANVDFATGLEPFSLAIGDLDRDGKPDLAVANYLSNSLSLFRNADLLLSPPIINSFTPLFAKSGDTVVLTGNNFNASTNNNIVFFGATRALVTAATTTSITVIVPNGATYAPITVLNTFTSLAAFSGISFTPIFSPIKTNITGNDFLSKQDFTTSSNPYSIAVGDLDGDGKPDLAVTNLNANTLSIYRNVTTNISTIAGGFAPKVDFATDLTPYSVAINDLDGDGKLDLAVTNFASNTVSVLRNTSTAGSITTNSFATKVDFSTGSNPASIAISDLDGDGKPDLAVTNNGSNTVSILRNRSFLGSMDLASFTAKVDFTTGFQPWSVAIADFDGDSKPDLAIANVGSNTVSVLRNVSTSGNILVNSFATKVDFITDMGPTFLALGDLDIDGKPDLVVANGASNTVSIFRNTSTAGSIVAGSFSAKVDFATGSTPYSVKIGDLDGDSKPDLAIANYNSNTVSILRNTSTAGSIVSNSFAARVDFTTGLQPCTVALCDLDQDGKPDIVTTNYGSNTVSVLRNEYLPPTIISFTPLSAKPGDLVTLTGTNFNTIAGNNMVFFGAIRATVTSATANSLTATVPVGATYAPITLLNSSTSLAATSFNNFTPRFSPPKNNIAPTDFLAKQDFGTELYPRSIAIGDLDGDGKLDLVVANYLVHSISIYRNTTSISTAGGIVASSFATKVDIGVGFYPLSVKMGDLDGDGKLDLAIAHADNGFVLVLLNKSIAGNLAASNFDTRQVFTTGANPTSIAIGDLDGDGKPELVTANFNSNTVSVLRNVFVRGTINASSFANKIDFATGLNPSSVSICDLDGDGKLDLSVINSTSNTFSVLYNNSNPVTVGSISFANKIDFATGLNPSALAIGDLNDDGKPDLVVANYNSKNISVFQNASTPGSIVSSSFALKQDFITDTVPSSLVISDLNGDGKPDIVVSSLNTNTIAILRNTSTSGNINASSFALKVKFDVGNSPISMAVGDLDGDSKPDIAVSNNQSQSISVLRNADTLVPSPIITSFNPLAAKPGDMVTITGANFNTVSASNIVFFGATRANVISANNTTITATVPVGATYAPITALNVNTKLTGQSPNNFTPIFTPPKSTIAASDFATELRLLSSNISFDTKPYLVAIGDLDGDGKSDLVTYNKSNINFSVLRNTSISGSINSNSFAPKVDFATIWNSSPFSLALSDLDGDGKLDIVITGSEGKVSIFRNTSSIGSITTSSFASRVDFETGVNPVAMAIGDLDGDGKPDLAIIKQNTNVVSVLRNTSTGGNIVPGSFATQVEFPLSAPLSNIGLPRSIAIGDLDGDGKLDLAVTLSHPNPIGVPGVATVSVLRNTSSIGNIVPNSFAAAVHFETALLSQSVAIGDLDGDGKPDLAVTTVANVVSVLRNTSTPGSIVASSFAPRVDFTTGDAISGNLAISDLNGDGKPDLAIVNPNSTVISLLRNTSTPGSIVTSSFATKQDIYISNNDYPFSLAVGDLDGDNKPDLAVTSISANATGYHLSLFRNKDISVPVTITNFKAFQKNTDIQIAWDTKNEINLQAYEVEKSRDGLSFGKIGVVAATALSSYTWLDINPTNGNNYYRLKMIDKDGSFKYSAIVNVKIGNIKNTITIANNPIINKTLVLQIENMVKDKLTILVYNNSGQKMLQTSINHSGGSTTQAVNLGNTVAGTYQLSIVGKEVKFSKTIIVE